MILTKDFWLDATERAIATFAQVVLSIVGVMYPVAAAASEESLRTAITLAIEGLPLIILTGLGGAGLSVLKSITAAYKAGKATASLVNK